MAYKHAIVLQPIPILLSPCAHLALAPTPVSTSRSRHHPMPLKPQTLRRQSTTIVHHYDPETLPLLVLHPQSLLYPNSAPISIVEDPEKAALAHHASLYRNHHQRQIKCFSQAAEERAMSVRLRQLLLGCVMGVS
ncbi:hypothetical protein FH972_024134 [Carpinus fangiana]|uniref:Uncharacterized protein n=1 Tax=Carpinus fangiana TaxID=176857 RepID=A0A5N6KXZ1_9ROSI|nr:hypothetical protein FH972_024134 [Carpinus fangiana]